MGWWRWTAIVGLCVGIVGSVAADALSFSGADFVSLPVHVLSPDNSAVAGTTISLRSMERQALREGLANYDWAPVVTDASGSATLRYPTALVPVSGSRRGWEILPVYAIIAPTSNSAGAIVSLPKSPQADEVLPIRIAEGYILRGMVNLPDGKPLEGQPVIINHDLKAQSHTGYGGEIWEREATTDKDGSFVFKHVNASPVTIQLRGLAGFYWGDTVINGKRAYDCADEFQPEWGNTENRYEIRLEKSPARVYQGTALDEAGNPVAGAEVLIGYSRHKEERTWADSHAWETTHTLSDGTWKLEVPTKWVMWGEIRQQGNRAAQPGTAEIAATGKIDLTTTAPQVVRLGPDHSGNLMPAK